MHARNLVVGLSLLAFAGTGSPFQIPGSGGTSSTPANRIVGLWSTLGMVSDCETGAGAFQVRNNLLFHAGGTVTENIGPTTARNTGLGLWSYDQTTGWYTLQLHFSRYSNNVLIGTSRVDRQLFMTADGQQVSGPVRSTGYALDGSVTSTVCGTATSDRIF